MILLCYMLKVISTDLPTKVKYINIDKTWKISLTVGNFKQTHILVYNLVAHNLIWTENFRMRYP